MKLLLCKFNEIDNFNFKHMLEYYQKYFVPTRGFEVNDMVADAVGAILALPLFNWLNKKILRKHS